MFALFCLARNDWYALCCTGVAILWYGLNFKYYLQCLTTCQHLRELCNTRMPCGSSHTIADTVVYTLLSEWYRCIHLKFCFIIQQHFLY